jgi:tetratricopeptide (TPR) repeat protein
VLGAAAVIGRHIERAVLLEVAVHLGQDERATLLALESTRQAGLLLEAGEDAYMFPHDLIREVLATDLGAARRASLHRQVAQALEAAPGEPALERLAFHYQHAGRLEQAAGYLERAGDRAETLFAHAEAAGYYRELVAVFTRLGRPMPRAEAMEKLGGALKLMGQYMQALEAVEQAIALHRTHGHLEGLGRATAEMMWILATKGASDQDIEHFRALLEVLETHGPTAQLANLYAGLAMHYMGTIHRDQLPVAARAVEIARVVGERGSLAFAQAAYGYALLMTGSPPEALRIAEETIPLAQEAGQIFPLWGALHVCMMIHASTGNFAAARRYAEQAIMVSERQGEEIYLAWMTAFVGHYAFLSGDWEEAETVLTRSLAIGRQVGSPRALVVTLPMLGNLRLAQGARDEGYAYLDEGISLAESYHSDLTFRRMGQAWRAEGELLEGHPEAAYQRLAPLFDGHRLDEWGLHFALSGWVWAQLALGKQEEVQQVLSRGEAYLRARGDRLRLVDVLRVRALLETRQEQWQEAERTLEEALSLTRSMSYPYAEAKVLSVAGQRAARLGQPAQARELWEAALTICARLGERLYADRIEAARAQLEG